ncbi:MAG TPA: thioredoxin domain-containing protein [Myxococcota bacterium]|nr:thioredoxin domain-containing protein [Myxococcota bacterium]
MERTPEQVRAQGNALAHAASLYLRQHGHNPVDWRPWGSDALDDARRLDRPIFLSIGYASCHWCHVMEAESFQDDAVADLLNRHFVPIKVDREERPDLDAAYMEAVQALTGQGGWPMSVFLAPDLRPFHGGTYFRRDDFLGLCERVALLWRTRRDQVLVQAARLASALAGEEPVAKTAPGPDGEPAGGTPPVPQAFLDRVARRVADAFDPHWGGLDGRMKFPMVPLLAFLLDRARRPGADGVRQALATTLDAMARGGIRDQVGGGFHRYATEPTWTVPHFEKMLYDNAQLLRLYAEASVAFQRADWAEVARDTATFLMNDLALDDGLFAASLDADTAEGEGAFYAWTPAQVAEVAGTDGPALAEALGIVADGVFDGASLPTRRRAGAAGRETASDDLIARWRPALASARALRPLPTRDRKVVAAWNGLAIGALARAGVLLDAPAFVDAAVRAADRLWTVHATDDGGLWRVSNGGVAAERACLDDLAEVALGFLDLWEATFDSRHLARAQALVTHAEDRHARPRGGWFMTPDDVHAPLGRRVEAEDNATRSGYAGMCRATLRLAMLQGSPPLWDRAREAIAAAAPAAMRHPAAMPGLLHVAGALAGSGLDVVVAGDAEAPDTRAMLGMLRRDLPDGAVLSRVPAEGAAPALLALLPTVAGKAARDGRATAYVCRFGACAAPASTLEALAARLAAAIEGPDRPDGGEARVTGS